MLCEVSTDIKGGGIGLILSFNEYLKNIELNMRYKFYNRKRKDIVNNNNVAKGLCM